MHGFGILTIRYFYGLLLIIYRPTLYKSAPDKGA